jgi:hypothetical protein
MSGKPGRNMTEAGVYARKMFPKRLPHDAARTVRRMGGAVKLKALSPEVQRILLGISKCQ